MILLGVGSNLESPDHGSSRATIEAGLVALETRDIQVVAQSGWYRTLPVPESSQPWFVNLVVSVETAMTAELLLETLHAVEQQFGRVRSVRDAARVIDLDILDFDGRISDCPKLTLPHPRMHERAFVLIPLRDVAPDWRHPSCGRTVNELIAALPSGSTDGDRVRRLD